MQHQFRLRGRAGGEIQQQRIVGVGFAVGVELSGCGQQFVVTSPTDYRLAHGDAGQLGIHPGELPRLGTGGNDVTRPAAIETVRQVIGRE